MNRKLTILLLVAASTCACGCSWSNRSTEPAKGLSASQATPKPLTEIRIDILADGRCLVNGQAVATAPELQSRLAGLTDDRSIPVHIAVDPKSSRATMYQVCSAALNAGYMNVVIDGQRE